MKTIKSITKEDEVKFLEKRISKSLLKIQELGRLTSNESKNLRRMKRRLNEITLLD